MGLGGTRTVHARLRVDDASMRATAGWSRRPSPRLRRLRPGHVLAREQEQLGCAGGRRDLHALAADVEDVEGDVHGMDPHNPTALTARSPFGSFGSDFPGV